MILDHCHFLFIILVFFVISGGNKELNFIGVGDQSVLETERRTVLAPEDAKRLIAAGRTTLHIFGLP
jgi:hypothetical protein